MSKWTCPVCNEIFTDLPTKEDQITHMNLVHKVDISNAEHPVRSLVCDLIDEVEAKIRSAHPAVDRYAKRWETEDEEKPNTLLYGENYYDLEESIVNQIVELLEKNYGVKV